MALGLDLARPLIAGAAGSGAPVLDIAVTDPAQAPQGGPEASDVVPPWHARRKVDFRKARRLGKNDGLFVWTKSYQQSAILSATQWSLYRHRLRCALFASPPPSAGFVLAASL